MKVMIVGGGGREHALGLALARSPRVRELISAPGNAGLGRLGRRLPIAATDVEALAEAAAREEADLVVVGPEDPLCAGLVDRLKERGVLAFGPSASAARLEGSKAFAKAMMEACGVPTARYARFSEAEAALRYAREQGAPLVVKADGLAAGKGVVVAETLEEAEAAIRTIMVERAFGEAGAEVVIEERLVGPEVSFHALCDGERYLPLAAAQDHKRLLEGDRGPNTGGMGTYSPPPMVTEAVDRAIRERVIEPLLAGMREVGAPFRGVLFAGLMIVDGEPKVLEFNVRFGDPETEALLPRLKSDLLPLLLGAAEGDLRGAAVEWGAPASACVVLASGGYPGPYKKGLPIEGIEAAEAVPGAHLCFAGVERDDEGRWVTAGGRVLAVCATGESVAEAAARAYEAADRIRFEGKQLRRDIGWQAR